MPTESATLQQGSTDTRVYSLQADLAILKYYTGISDGVFGSNTKNAVIKFQQQHGLKADGIAGYKTQAALRQTAWLAERPLVKQGSQGRDVETVQSILKSAVDYGVGNYGITSIDGVFGANTHAAVIKFQKANNLTADGVVGAATWKELSRLKAFDMEPEVIVSNDIFPMEPAC